VPEIDPEPVPEPIQTQPSLYDELLPFTAQGQLPNGIHSPGSIQKNDNNNNNLHVQQKTPPKTPAEKVIGNGISATVDDAGSSQILTGSPKSSVVVVPNGTGSSTKMLKEVINKTSDESSKSESFEVDW